MRQLVVGSLLLRSHCGCWMVCVEKGRLLNDVLYLHSCSRPHLAVESLYCCSCSCDLSLKTEHAPHVLDWVRTVLDHLYLYLPHELVLYLYTSSYSQRCSLLALRTGSRHLLPPARTPARPLPTRMRPLALLRSPLLPRTLALRRSLAFREAPRECCRAFLVLAVSRTG